MATITNESEEMYLKTIYQLSKISINVRSKDIADLLNYQKSSVSNGMKNLEAKGYIEFNSDRSLHLTKKGQQKALRVEERHVVLQKVLEGLGADKNLAEDEACKIEHVISDELLDVLEDYLKKQN